jgi:hypothetical protein
VIPVHVEIAVSFAEMVTVPVGLPDVAVTVTLIVTVVPGAALADVVVINVAVATGGTA